MAYTRFTNVLARLMVKGIDPTTSAGRNALNNWVIECVPNVTTIAYDSSLDVLEIVESYVQPPRINELGEVTNIDLTIW